MTRRNAAARFTTTAREHVDVAAAGVVHDDAHRSALERVHLVTDADPGEVVLLDVGLEQSTIGGAAHRLPSSG
jgi:hypothetical protein